MTEESPYKPFRKKDAARSKSMKMVPELHKEDRTIELARVLGLSLQDWTLAYVLKDAILGHEDWTNVRSPHGLMIDCIFLVGKHVGCKTVTQSSIQKLTKKLWGLSTMPRPHEWRKRFQDVIQEVFDANDVGNMEA